MSDIYDRVKGDQNIFNQLLSRIPGFAGYVERAQRRVADKMLREALANTSKRCGSGFLLCNGRFWGRGNWN